MVITGGLIDFKPEHCIEYKTLFSSRSLEKSCCFQVSSTSLTLFHMILAMQGELAKARKGEKGIYVFFFCFRVFAFVCVVFFSHLRGPTITVKT